MSEEARQVIIGELKDRATAKKVEGTRMAEGPLRQSWLSKVRGDALGYRERFVFSFLIGAAFSFFLFIAPFYWLSLRYVRVGQSRDLQIQGNV